MSSTPTPDALTALLARLADRLDSLEARLDCIEAPTGPTIAAATSEAAKTSKPPTTTKGKGRAQALQAPSKAKPAKKDRPTKKDATPSIPAPLPLAQMFSTEGKTDRHLVTVVIPDASAQHVVGQGGKGLKQIHDISGARVSAYTLANGSRDERHVSIRGTDLQIGDALVVLGKRLARKKIRPPKAKKTGPSEDSPTPARPLPTKPSSTLPRHSTTQRAGPSTGPRIVEVPTGETDKSPVTPIVASPSPHSTPAVPNTEGSSSHSRPTVAPISTGVDDFRNASPLSGLPLTGAHRLDPYEISQASLGRGGTARCSGAGTPRMRGRW